MFEEIWPYETFWFGSKSMQLDCQKPYEDNTNRPNRIELASQCRRLVSFKHFWHLFFSLRSVYIYLFLSFNITLFRYFLPFNYINCASLMDQTKIQFVLWHIYKKHDILCYRWKEFVNSIARALSAIDYFQITIRDSLSSDFHFRKIYDRTQQKARDTMKIEDKLQTVFQLYHRDLESGFLHFILIHKSVSQLKNP